jgi:hypothetical protein
VVRHLSSQLTKLSGDFGRRKMSGPQVLNDMLTDPDVCELLAKM